MESLTMAVRCFIPYHMQSLMHDIVAIMHSHDRQSHTCMKTGKIVDPISHA